MAEEFFMYKGFPLVRKNKEIYYGNMSDELVTTIRIVSTHKENEIYKVISSALLSKFVTFKQKARLKILIYND